MDELRQSEFNGHGSLLLRRAAVFSVPLFLLFIVSILSAVNLVKIMTYSKSVGVIANITVSTTQGKLSTTFYDHAVSFETAAKHNIYANVGKTVFIEPYTKGELVTVYYSPEDPFIAFTNHPATIWFVPISVASVAVIWLIIGVVLSWPDLKKR